MPTQGRLLWPGIAAVAYVCFAALPASEQPVAVLTTLGLTAALLVQVWRRTDRAEPGEHRVEATARSALRATAWGTCLWVAARVGAPGRPTLDAAANLGAGTASVAALVALARIAPLGGVLSPHPATRSLDAAAFSGLLWGIAVAIPATRAFVPSDDLILDPLAIDYATTTAGVGSLLVFIASTWRLRLLRRLEIGVSERAAGALALSLTAFSIAVPASAANVAPPDRILPLAVIGASLACAWVATAKEPTTVATALRGTLAVMILGVPTILLIGVAAREAPRFSGAIALLGCTLSILVGLIARSVARPLGPEQSRWLSAVDAACRGALQPEPDAAIQAALVALRATGSTPEARPELWRSNPPEILSVDVAGYLHVERGDAPRRLYDIAMKEPERTLRAEVLQALQVRRPETRPLLAWFETRRAFSATLVLDDDGPIGFLLLPRGRRTHPMTLEEARALRILSDRISALLAVSSALARSRKRQVEAERRMQLIEAERDRLERMVVLGGSRHQAFARHLARPLRGSAYGPAARMALDEAERAARGGGAVVLRVPCGVDASAWAAAVHLASPRSAGPLVFADATSSAQHDVARWQDKAESPLTLADGGTVVLTDAHFLPAAVQEAIVIEWSARRHGALESSVAAPGLVAVVRAPVAELVEQGLVSRSLARLMGDREIELPTLAERAEDLRALVLGTLASTGAQHRGEPLGIEGRALQHLLDHPWPGNDWELRDVLGRAAEVATGPVVTVGDLAAVGFRTEATPTPLPPAPSQLGHRRGRRATNVRSRR